MTTYVIPAVYSLAVWRSLSTDFRPMTLRHHLSAVLLFSAVWQSGYKPTRNGRPMTLRRQVSLGLLFFRVNFIIAQKKSNFKMFFIQIEFSNTFLIVCSPFKGQDCHHQYGRNYSYANTSRMVS